ncbi:putative telomerase-associated protein [Trypanosoma theileri]|uniref:Putative telomerase-associated protein n=1 Tax=Trypanosoma theileri TaxID=67003 RepID=A0A1X0NSQ1_9TRYP|nr:putative telomerase-associated protein [Trypanosoma theileri]ORC87568.1 putative telomerase-associated protein [Trypanosoma theileri]
MTDTHSSTVRTNQRRLKHEEDSNPDESFSFSHYSETVADVRHEKDELIGRVSASLLQEVQFPPKPPPLSPQANAQLENTIRIAELVNIISSMDGEFVLKLALYIRHDLNIRRTAALLVALSAFQPKCQPFLKCYMKRIIRLPSDWLTIANIAMQKPYECLYINYGKEEENEAVNFIQERKGIPNALRHALVATFKLFDEFTLAKYNNERSVKRARAKKKEELKKNEMSTTNTTTTNTITTAMTPFPQEHYYYYYYSTLTIKELIRRLHISRPAYIVCCLLGKRYPNSEEAFRQEGLDEGGTRTFDPTQCGRRMKLPVPETWETQLSAHGNHGFIWDNLVERKQLPFMAALRNLRNMILHNCSEKTHTIIMNRFTSEEEVLMSRQFPYRFLSAYESLKFQPKKAIKRLYTKPPSGAKRKICKDKPPSEKYVKLLQTQYQSTLNQAAEISARVNIVPIRGSSLIILNASYESMFSSNYGMADIDKAALLAVSFKYACEHCELLILCGDQYRVMGWDFRHEGGILENAERVGYFCRELMWPERDPYSSSTEWSSPRWIDPSTKIKFPYAYLDNLIEHRVNLQSLVVMGGKHSCFTGQNDAPSLGDLPVYLERMRRICNEELLFVGLSTSFDVELNIQLRYNHKHDILLTGFSDAVLRIVAERVSGGPRRYIERADEVYDVNRAAIRPDQTFKKELRVLQQVSKLEKKRRMHSYVQTLESFSDEALVGGSTSATIGSEENVSPSSPKKKKTTTAAAADKTSEEVGNKNKIGLISPEPLFLSTYHDCRFFISSTFIDMESERNALVLDVFPRLRRWVAEAGLHVNILDVDLRWGITEDATSSNLSVSVCLNEVSRCSPFFLGILGSRYGYCPPTLYHRVDEDVDPADFAWLRQYPLEQSEENKMSVTEMEMRHAIFTSARRTGKRIPLTMAFLIRDQTTLINSLPVGRERDAYAPDTPTTMQSITKLTSYLKTQGAPIIPYTATHKATVDNPFSTFSLTNAMTMPSITSTNNLTSTISATTIPLDMTDFSRKAYVALKSIVQHHFDLPVELGGGYDNVEAHQDTAKNNPEATHKSRVNQTLYEREHLDQLSFTSTLLKTFVPPMGFVEKLSLFVLSGRDPTSSITTTTTIKTEGAVEKEEGGTIMTNTNPTNPNPTTITTNAILSSTSTTPYTMDSEHNVLLLQGTEGNGASTISAAVAAHVAKREDTNVMVVHFACQASDGSLRRLVYYIASSLVYRLGLQEDFCVRESDPITLLLQLLPRIYDAAKKKKQICIILDGMDKSPYSTEILSNLGWLVHPGTGSEIRFLVTTSFGSPIATALKSRLPPARSIPLPDLSMSERAELVRRHLASYGKRLQESFRVNELKLLLRKTGASQASYLTYAITYLRLFSTFDTLRSDIVRLPSTLSQLHLEAYKKLEERFDEKTCRTVLIALYLAHDIGGIKEFNLYRLVSNVAPASRLVMLLNGTCLRIVRRRVAISSASFEASIAARYLPRSSDVIDACAKFLAAELYFRPVSIDAERYDVRQSIRVALESIRRCTEREKCVFNPYRYSASQLLALLHFALRAKEYEALSVLASYLPLVENLIVNATYLQRFLNILSQAVMLNSQLSNKLSPIVDFLQEHYSILECRPMILRQYVRNRNYLNNVFHDVLSPSESRKTGGCRNDTWVKWLNKNQKSEEGRTIIFPSTEPIQTLALSDDGNYIAGGGDDLMVRVIPQGRLDQIAASLKHNAPVTAIAFLPHRSHILLTGCGRGVLRVWSLEDNSLLQQSFISHKRCISSIACHPTESIVCTGSYDSSCALWQVVSSVAEATVRSSLEANEILKHHNAPVSCVAYHGSGEILATGSWEGRVYFINTERLRESLHHVTTLNLSKESVASTKLPYEYHMVKTGSPVRALAFMPSMVVTCAIALYDGDICLYDYASAECSARLKLHVGIPITCLTFSPDAVFMASANEHGGVRITYAGVTGTTFTTLNAHRSAVTAVAFHQKKPRTLFTSSMERNLKQWSLAKTDYTDSTLLNGKHAMIVTACAAASDGSFFVTAGVDGLALVFTAHEDVSGGVSDYTRSKEESFTPYFSLSHEQNRVSCICIGMQNKRILCGTAVGEVFVWAATPGLDRREGLLLQRISVAEEGVYPVVFVGCVVEKASDKSKHQHRKHKQCKDNNNDDNNDYNDDNNNNNDYDDDDDDDDDNDNAVYTSNLHNYSLRARATAFTANGMMAAWEMYEDDTRMISVTGPQRPTEKMCRRVFSPYSLQQVGVVVRERELKTEKLSVCVCTDQIAEAEDKKYEALLTDKAAKSESSSDNYERFSCHSSTIEEDEEKEEESEEVSRDLDSDKNKNNDEMEMEDHRRAPQRATFKWVKPFECVRLDKDGMCSGVSSPTGMSNTSISLSVKLAEEIIGGLPLMWRERESHREEEEEEEKEEKEEKEVIGQKEKKTELSDNNNNSNSNSNSERSSNGTGDTINDNTVASPNTEDSKGLTVSNNCDGSCKNRNMYLLDGSFIVVGRQRCHLAVASLQSMIALPIQKISPDYHIVESEINDEYMLEKGDAFLCVSNRIRVRGAWTEVKRKNSTSSFLSSSSLLFSSSSLFSLLFALGTSSGTVLLIEAIYERDSTITAESEDEGDAIQFMINNNNNNNNTLGCMLQYKRGVRLILRHSAEMVGRHGRRVPVDSIALTTGPSETVKSSEDTTEPYIWRDVFTPLHLTVGCRDGSVRLFTVFPFREVEHALGEESINPGKSVRHVLPEEEEEEEEEEEDEDEEMENIKKDEKEAKCAFIKGKWHERGIFFASSGITTVTTLQMPDKMLGRRNSTNLPFSTINTGTTIMNTTTTTTNNNNNNNNNNNTNFGISNWLSSWSLLSTIHIVGDWLGNVYQLQLKRGSGNGSRLGKRDFTRPHTFSIFADGSSSQAWSAIMRDDEEKEGQRSRYNREARPTLLELMRRETNLHLSVSNLLSAGRRGTKWRNEERTIAALFSSHLNEDPWSEAAAAAAGNLSTTVPTHEHPSTQVNTTNTTTGMSMTVPPYEMILQQVPPELEGEKRNEWIREQQRLLVEALQAHRNAVKAREVLSKYSKDVLLSMGVDLDS